jgi:Tol biopolymer transport system component
VILRRIAALLFVPLLVAFGSGVYFYLGTLKSKTVKEHAELPTAAKPKFVLPGTMIVVQDGRLFKLEEGGFTEIGPSGDWSEPALTPDHSAMVVVKRSGLSSDLYLLDTNGRVIKRLTQDSSRIVNGNHWTFYPRVTSDGKSVVYSYDSPKYGYQVDFSIWTMPLNGTQLQARRRTIPNSHTGGDINPVPLSGTSILYVSHSIDPSTAVHSQIMLQTRAFAEPRPLTALSDNCSQPALSADGKQLAMICTGGKQTARLEVAPFNGTTLGPAKVLVENGLFAQPTWSPDGTALAYFAPTGSAGHFQLWYLVLPPAATPTASASASASASSTPVAATVPTPIQVTQGVDLTATSPPAWY